MQGFMPRSLDAERDNIFSIYVYFFLLVVYWPSLFSDGSMFSVTVILTTGYHLWPIWHQLSGILVVGLHYWVDSRAWPLKRTRYQASRFQVYNMLPLWHLSSTKYVHMHAPRAIVSRARWKNLSLYELNDKRLFFRWFHPRIIRSENKRRFW